MRKLFPVWLRSRLISAGLELVLSYTENSCIALHYRQFTKIIKIKIVSYTINDYYITSIVSRERFERW